MRVPVAGTKASLGIVLLQTQARQKCPFVSLGVRKSFLSGLWDDREGCVKLGKVHFSP